MGDEGEPGAACGVSRADQSRREAAKVAGSLGSGMRARRAGSTKAAKWRNSRRRPSRTASARSPVKSVKKAKGRVSPHSSPMNISGMCGESSRIAVSARTIGSGASASSRSPKARLPAWSWFCRKSTKAVGGRWPLGTPRGFAGEGRLALVGEAFGQGAGEVRPAAGDVVGVVTFGLAGGDDVGDVVEVVVPFGGVERDLAAGAALVQVGDVAGVLGGQVDVPVGEGGADGAGDLDQESSSEFGSWTWSIASNRRPSRRNSSSQYKALSMKNRRTAGARRRCRRPRGCGGRVEELRGVGRQVVPVGAEVVVDDVEEHHQAEAVGGVDQRLQRVGRAVGGVRGVVEHAVVAPAAVPRTGHRHQLDGGEAGGGEVRQAGARGVEGAFRGEGADVDLGDHRLVPGAAVPGDRPAVGGGVDEAGEAVDGAGLGAGGGVGNEGAVGEDEGVGVAGNGGDGGLVPAIVCGVQGVVAAGEAELQGRGGGGPEAEVGAGVGEEGRAPGEGGGGQWFTAICSTYNSCTSHVQRMYMNALLGGVLTGFGGYLRPNGALRCKAVSRPALAPSPGGGPEPTLGDACVASVRRLEYPWCKRVVRRAWAPRAGPG